MLCFTINFSNVSKLFSFFARKRMTSQATTTIGNSEENLFGSNERPYKSTNSNEIQLMVIVVSTYTLIIIAVCAYRTNKPYALRVFTNGSFWLVQLMLWMCCRHVLGYFSHWHLTVLHISRVIFERRALLKIRHLFRRQFLRFIFFFIT